MDLLLRAADLADGTGAPLRRADIAIERGRIAAIAETGELEPSKAAEVIEARGLLVTPGFIDPHTHYDGQATWDDRLAPSCDHGVTTAVMGNCGIVVSSLGSTFLPAEDASLEPDPATSLARRMQAEGLSPQEVVYDALCDAAERPGGSGFLHVFMGNYAEGSLDAVRDMICRPGTLVGGGDGGAHVTVICDASYPTFMLQHRVRDRVRGERIPVETAVRMLTRDPAELYGFRDRGAVAKGLRADLNVIDLDRIALETPRVVHDLPTGAPRLLQGARG